MIISFKTITSEKRNMKKIKERPCPWHNFAVHRQGQRICIFRGEDTAQAQLCGQHCKNFTTLALTSEYL